MTDLEISLEKNINLLPGVIGPISSPNAYSIQ